MKYLTSFLVFTLVAILSFFLVLIINTSKKPESKPAEKAFCCVSNTFVGGSEIGKKLFKNNCATCHAKNMVSDAAGPALAGTFKFWESDTLSLVSYLNDSELFFKTTKNERIITLMQNYKPTRSHKFNLTVGEVKHIVDYVEMIY